MTYILVVLIALASGQTIGPFSHKKVFNSELACETFFEDQGSDEIEAEMEKRFPGQEFEVFYDCPAHGE